MLEVLRDGRLQWLGARREVILSGGVVNSPQLLMLSGIGPGAALQALGIPVAVDAPGVGRNLPGPLECVPDAAHPARSVLQRRAACAA